jgi:hypothetical protein
MTTLCVLVVLATPLAVAADAASQRTLVLRMDGGAIRAGAAVRATAIVTNDRETTAEWIFEAYLYSSDPSAAVPRKMSKPLRLAPGEAASIDVSVPTDRLTRAGRYELRAELFDSRFQVISREVAAVTVEGVLEPINLTATICRDADCKLPARAFVRGDTVYLGYRVDPASARVSAVLVVNGKSRKELSLPTSFPAQESGDYTIMLVASSPDRRSVTKSLSFAVTDAAPPVSSP